MKKLGILIFVALIGIVGLTLNDQDFLKTQSVSPKTETQPSQEFETLEDKVNLAQSAIKPIEKDQILTHKQKTIESIMKISEMGQYQKQVLEGMKTAFQKNKSKIKKDKWVAFSESLANYPMEEEFTELLNKYSDEELDYLLGHFTHPAQEQMKVAQKEKTGELMQLTQQTNAFQTSPDKKEFIDQIFEEAKVLESTKAISDAVTEPILMAVFKQTNPKANVQEMEAFAKQIMESRKEKSDRVLENVLLWSFSQVDRDTLEDLSEYVNGHSDKNINDKYLKDLKNLYRKYGRHIGKELTKLY